MAPSAVRRRRPRPPGISASGLDGLCRGWPRAVAGSDNALYIVDTGNRRILEARLGYAA